MFKEFDLTIISAILQCVGSPKAELANFKPVIRSAMSMKIVWSLIYLTEKKFEDWQDNQILVIFQNKRFFGTSGMLQKFRTLNISDCKKFRTLILRTDEMFETINVQNRSVVMYVVCFCAR